MLSKSDSSQFEAALLSIIKHNPALSSALSASGNQEKTATQLMEPVLSTRKRCQRKHFIQAVTVGRSIFLVTNLSEDAPIQATRPASSSSESPFLLCL